MTAKSSDFRMVKYRDPETGKLKFRKKRTDDEIVKQEDVKEKAVSKAQQKFFGMVRAKQKGEMPNASPEVKKAAASMSKKDVKDFAATKHKGLPAKKEGFAVKYNNPGHEKHGGEKHFDNKMSADKHAARGNKVDKVGGKYTVHKTNDKGHTVEGYIGAKGEKGRDYHNAGTFDKDTAYGHAKKHNGVVHKDPSGKYLVKHGRGKHVGEALAAPAKPVTDKEIKRRQNISKTAKKNSPKTTMKGLRSRLAGESSDAYGKSQDAIANKKKHAGISQQDRLTLAKLDALMKKQRKEEVDLEEKNVPTNPKLWAKFKAQAKSKFDVYPSAYANGWAAKQYKAAGGGWKSKSEAVEEGVDRANSDGRGKGYTASHEKSAKGYRAVMKSPSGKTSYVGSQHYKTKDHAEGEAKAYHKAYFGHPSLRANDKGARNAVHKYRQSNKQHHATNEATYQGKKVPLNKPMKGDVAKSKVYVDPDGDGKAKKVNFGDKNMTIKKHIPGRRKSFRARHNCDNPGPKDKARYWSCKAW